MLNKVYTLYPEVENFHHGFLKVDDLHTIYYELSGNPLGVPVIFLHGGPGSGCNSTQRRFFDPAYYCIILFDQRGCGKSKPQGATLQNTTDDLVCDMEAIRKKLNINQWLVFGGSWGSTLAICYALKYPNEVSGLILRGVFLSRLSELNWFLGDVAHFYPEVWHALITYLPKDAQHNVLDAYAERIFNDDATINIPAAEQWNAFENAIMRLIPNAPKSEEMPEGANITLDAALKTKEDQAALEVARARVQIHYIQHHCFVDGEKMLTDCKTLAHIPTIIVQGRYDMVCPPISAWELSCVMPHAAFYMVQDAGHSAMETGITSALIAATENFKTHTPVINL